jgi:ferric-dicitrate binding protein FerR (iron transport regulator)
MAETPYRWPILLKKFKDKTITPDELKELDRQRRSSPIKQQQYLEITSPEHFLKKVQELHKINSEEAWEKIQRASQQVEMPKAKRTILRKIRNWSLSVAAVALLFIGGFLLTSHREPEVKEYSYLKIDDKEYRLEVNGNFQIKANGIFIIYKYPSLYITGSTGTIPDDIVNTALVTTRGINLSIVLSDGSKVNLNAASSITFPLCFIKKERKVTVNGEALFNVNPNMEKPFIVTAKNVTVEALGTIFNVANYKKEELKTTLIQGKIKLTVGKRSYDLKAGQEAKIDDDEALISSPKDNSQAIAWTNNEFDFENTKIKEIINELGRWYNKEVEFKGDFSNKAYYGRFARTNPLDSIITVLNAQNGIRVTQEDNRLVVKGDK